MLVWLGCAAVAGPLHAQFTLQDSGTTADLRGIVNVGNGTAWASGTHGTVLRTEDSGFVWQGCSVPPGAEQLDFRGIQAFDDQTAIVMSSGKGDLSRVYKTTDGCKSWKLVFTNPDADGFFDAISMSPSGAVVMGDPVGGVFAFFVSDRDEQKWVSLNSPHSGTKAPEALPGEALFAASNSSMDANGGNCVGFVTGGLPGAAIYLPDLRTMPGDTSPERTAAFWTTYKRYPLPLARSASGGAFSVRDMSDGKNEYWIIVGGDYSKPDQTAGTAVTVRGAALSSIRKALPSQTPPHGYRSSVAFDRHAGAWIAVGPNGTDVSTDIGRNWRALKPGFGDDPNADKQWNALSLPYVVGPHGRIGRLRDDALSPGK
ncbi:WD40/YVTN/BNR-like repeat-containing protein [Terriglobus aquaticus]|uniref:WD40/YVTN/BNR-like repeat-containing protein n=2 Tax=Terriglobus aquaticus TaxID=940139 RepID=A0ABW9KPV2_9BACT